jgi:uncharacterized protein
MNFIFIAMLLGSFVMSNLLPVHLALTVIVACYAVFTVFAFITLPVEINASARGLAWLSLNRITTVEGQEKAKNALKWAASTYVIAALSSLATLLYFVTLLGGSDN